MIERLSSFLGSVLWRHTRELGRSGLVAIASIVAASAVLVMHGRETLEPGFALFSIAGLIVFNIVYFKLPPDRE